jgi:hypothetical protein
MSMVFKIRRREEECERKRDEAGRCTRERGGKRKKRMMRGYRYTVVVITISFTEREKRGKKCVHACERKRQERRCRNESGERAVKLPVQQRPSCRRTGTTHC